MGIPSVKTIQCIRGIDREKATLVREIMESVEQLDCKPWSGLEQIDAVIAERHRDASPLPVFQPRLQQRTQRRQQCHQFCHDCPGGPRAEARSEVRGSLSDARTA